jgi:hypothetical protein
VNRLSGSKSWLQFLGYVLRAPETDPGGELSQGKIRHFLRIRSGGTNARKTALGPVSEIRRGFTKIRGRLFSG